MLAASAGRGGIPGEAQAMGKDLALMAPAVTAAAMMANNRG